MRYGIPQYGKKQWERSHLKVSRAPESLVAGQVHNSPGKGAESQDVDFLEVPLQNVTIPLKNACPERMVSPRWILEAENLDSEYLKAIRMEKTKTGDKHIRKNTGTSGLSPIAAEIAQGLLEGIEYIRGSGNARTTRVTLPDPPPAYTQMEVRRIRARLGLTQRQFAVLINVTPKSVESWEQGIRHPSQAASRLLQILGDPGKLRQFERFAHASKE